MQDTGDLYRRYMEANEAAIADGATDADGERAGEARRAWVTATEKRIAKENEAWRLSRRARR